MPGKDYDGFVVFDGDPTEEELDYYLNSPPGAPLHKDTVEADDEKPEWDREDTEPPTYLTEEQLEDTPDEVFGDPVNRKYPIINQGDVWAAYKAIHGTDEEDKLKLNIRRLADRRMLRVPNGW